MLSLEELFCSVDDFCRGFEPQWKQQLLGSGLKLRNRVRSSTLSEMMTLLIGFHQSCYRNFKTYYQAKVQGKWADAFPGTVSYSHFIEWVPGTFANRFAESWRSWFLLAIESPKIKIPVWE